MNRLPAHVRPSQRSIESCHTVLVDGKLLCGGDLRDYATRHGLCKICGTTKTHRRSGTLLNRKWVPVTDVDSAGNYVVYKGHCLQPTCYTLHRAQERLGERQANQPRRSTRRSSSSSTSTFLTSTTTGGAPSRNSSHASILSLVASSAASSPPSSWSGSRKTIPRGQQRQANHSLATTTTNTIMYPPTHHFDIKYEPEIAVVTEGDEDETTERLYEDIIVLETFKSDDRDQIEWSDNDLETSTTATTKNSKRIRLLQELEDCGESNNMDRIVDILEQEQQEQQVVLFGLEQLGKCILLFHDENLSTDSTRKDWARVLWDMMQQQHQDKVILLQGIRTLGSVCSLSRDYAAQVVACRNSIPTLIRLFNNNNGDKEVRAHDQTTTEMIQAAAAVLVECLMSYGNQNDQPEQPNEQDPGRSSILSQEDVHTLVHHLVGGLVQSVEQQDKDDQQSPPTVDDTESSPATGDNDDGCNVGIRWQEYRVRSLYNLINHHDSGKQLVQAALVSSSTQDNNDSNGNNCHAALWELLSHHRVLTPVGQQATLSLLCLWNEANTSETTTSAHVSVGLAAATASIFELLTDSHSSETHQTVLTLLSKLVQHRQQQEEASIWQDVPTARACATGVCAALSHHSHQPQQLVRLGLLVLLEVASTMVSTDQQSKFFNNEETNAVMVNSVFECMNVDTAPDDNTIEIISLGMHLLALFFKWNDKESRRLVSDTGGTRVILKLFRYFAEKGQIIDQECLVHQTKRSTIMVVEQLIGTGFSAEQDKNDDFDKSILPCIHRVAQDEADTTILMALLRTSVVLLLRIVGSLPVVEEDSNDEERTVVATPGYIVTKLLLLQTGVGETLVDETLAQFAALYQQIDFNGKLNQKYTVVNASKTSSSVSLVTHSHPEIKAIFDVMESRKGNINTQHACCVALSSFFGPYSDEAVSDKALTEIATESLQILLDALMTHRSNAMIQASAADAYLLLLCRCDQHSVNEWTARLIGQCLQFTEITDTMAPTCVAACRLLANLLSRPRVGGQVMGIEAIKFLSILLQEQDSVIVLPATKVLALLMQHDSEESRQFVQEEGTASVIAVCLGNHHESRQIHTSLYSVLSSQTILQEAGFRRNITKSGGLKAIVDAMNIHYDDSGYIIAAYRSLLAMLAAAEADTVHALDEPICNAITLAYNAHTDNLETQTVGTDAIRNLCIKEQSCRKILARTIIPALLGSMEKHFTSPVLLASACTVIRMVARHDQQHSLIQYGAVKMMVNIMVEHPNSSDLLMEGLATLTKLSEDPFLRQTMDRQQAQDTLVGLIQANALNPDVLREAFGALNNIVVDQSSQSVARISHKVLAVLLHAVQCFLDVEGLQVNASLLLKSYTYEPENLHMLQGASDVLLPLLFAVSEKHRGEIRERVEYIIHSL